MEMPPQIQVARAVAVRGGAEPEGLVERERRWIGLVDVELDAPAAALASPLDGPADERSAETRAAGRLLDEQVFHQAVGPRAPDAVAVAHLDHPGRRRGVGGRAEQGVG